MDFHQRNVLWPRAYLPTPFASTPENPFSPLLTPRETPFFPSFLFLFLSGEVNVLGKKEKIKFAKSILGLRSVHARVHHVCLADSLAGF